VCRLKAGGNGGVRIRPYGCFNKAATRLVVGAAIHHRAGDPIGRDEFRQCPHEAASRYLDYMKATTAKSEKA